LIMESNSRMTWRAAWTRLPGVDLARPLDLGVFGVDRPGLLRGPRQPAPQIAPGSVIPRPADSPPAAGKGPLAATGTGRQCECPGLRPADLSTTQYVGDDGTLVYPAGGHRAGRRLVAGAGRQPGRGGIEIGQDPGRPACHDHGLANAQQRVSVLGQVGTPGRYPIESNTSILDLLAQAGGVTAGGSDIVYVLRQQKDGKEVRYPVDLKGWRTAPSRR